MSNDLHQAVERILAECDGETRLHDFRDGSMAYLTCDLQRDAHAGLNHHDPVYGIWWTACTLPEHGHSTAQDADLL